MVLLLFDGHGRDELQLVRSVGEPLSVEEFDARIRFSLVLPLLQFQARRLPDMNAVLGRAPRVDEQELIPTGRRPKQSGRSLQIGEVCSPGKIFERGTVLPKLYSRRSKQGVQQPRCTCGHKLPAFSPRLQHPIVGHTESPSAAKEVVGIQKKFALLHVPRAGFEEVSPLSVGHRVQQGAVD
jgi:hypothetical protein